MVAQPPHGPLLMAPGPIGKPITGAAKIQRKSEKILSFNSLFAVTEFFGLFGRAPTVAIAPPNAMAVSRGTDANTTAHLGMRIVFPGKEYGLKAIICNFAVWYQKNNTVHRTE